MSEASVTVFVTNMAPDHSYKSAARYGAIRPITQGNYPVFKTERLKEEIIEALIHSSKDDYLAFSGSSFVAALCLVIWMTLHKECKALLYDNKQNSYVPRKITREGIVELIEKERDRING